jgi:hypothetical protein
MDMHEMDMREMDMREFVNRTVVAGLVASVSVLLSLSVVGCGVAQRTTPVVVPPESTVVTPSPDSIPQIVPVVHIFLLRKGIFVPVERIGALINQSVDIERSIDAALRDIMESPSARERRSGLTSPVIDLLPRTKGRRLTNQLVDGVLTVDLQSLRVELRDAEPEVVQAVITQLAYTALIGSPGVGGVRFVLAADPLLLDDGTDVITLSDLSCLSEPCRLLPVTLPVDQSADLDLQPTITLGVPEPFTTTSVPK